MVVQYLQLQTVLMSLLIFSTFIITLHLTVAHSTLMATISKLQMWMRKTILHRKVMAVPFTGKVTMVLLKEAISPTTQMY